MVTALVSHLPVGHLPEEGGVQLRPGALTCPTEARGFSQCMKIVVARPAQTGPRASRPMRERRRGTRRSRASGSATVFNDQTRELGDKDRISLIVPHIRQPTKHRSRGGSAVKRGEAGVSLLCARAASKALSLNVVDRGSRSPCSEATMVRWVLVAIRVVGPGGSRAGL